MASVLGVVFCLSGCGIKIIGGAAATSSSNVASQLASSSASIIVTTGNSFSVPVSGGTPPYTYSILSGSGSISPSTGLYTASASPGSAVVRVTDSTGQVLDVPITVNPSISLNAASISLPIKSQYTFPFAAAGGVPPYSYSLTSGPGTVDPSSGLYTAATSSGASQLRVTDSLGNWTQAAIQNIPIRTNGSVNAVTSDGTSLYIGGNFTAINPYPAPGMIAVDTTTGNPVLSFDLQAGFNGGINAVAFSGNSVYVGGSFTTYRGLPAKYLAKLDLTTGNLDSSFTQATGFSAAVDALAISGTSLYVGGNFTSYRGAAANSLAKVDLATGTLDSSFTQATGFNNSVGALAVSGGSLYVGGGFTTYRGAAANYLAKLDLGTGSLDTTFTQATGFSGSVYGLAVTGSALYVGCGFTSYRGTAANGLAKLDLTNGNLDTAFTQATGFSGAVYTLAVSGSSLYAGGSFSAYRGAAAKNLAKLDLVSGNLDSTFTQATGFGSSVSALAVTGGSLYAGGYFTTYRGTTAKQLAKLDLTTGNLDTTFTQVTGFDSVVSALGVSGGTLYVGGAFVGYRGLPANYLAKLDLTSGAVDTAFTQATGFDSGVNALMISGSSLYAGGWFTAYRGAAAKRLAKIDLTTGSLDTAFTQTTGFDSSVKALVMSGTSLYVGGAFTAYRGSSAGFLAKLDLTSGNLDTAFTQATAFDLWVNDLAISGSALYVGGSFGFYRGVAAKFLAKLDLTNGNLDTTFTQATGFSSDVSALAVAGTSLYAGGLFATYRGAAANYLAKLDLTTGNMDSTFTQATGFDQPVNAIAISGGSLYAGGTFTTYRGATANSLAKLDLGTGNLDTTFTQGTGFDLGAYFLAVSGTSLYVGGPFTSYRGQRAYFWIPVDLTSGALAE